MNTSYASITFCNLPSDIILTICEHAASNPKDVLALAVVNKQLSSILSSSNDSFWKTIAQNFWTIIQSQSNDHSTVSWCTLNELQESISKIWKGWKWFLASMFSQAIDTEIYNHNKDIAHAACRGKELIFHSRSHEFNNSDSVYLLTNQWWNKYSSRQQHPGPIDNSLHFRASSVDPFINMCCVTPTFYCYLMARFGGGPSIERKITRGANGVAQLQQPIVLYATKDLCDIFTGEAPVAGVFNPEDTLGHVKEVMCAKMNMDPKRVSIWDFYEFQKTKEFTDMNLKIQDELIASEQTIFFEEYSLKV